MAVLDGIVVLDLSRLIAGPYAAMVLADLGARVIKVETLSGEEGRYFGPPFFEGTAALFHANNRGKESISLDFRTPAGRVILDKLIARSHVVVHNFRPDFLEKFRLGYEDLRAINPEIIYYAVSSFGSDTPYALKPAVDGVVQGYAGAFYASGQASDMPYRIGVPIVDVASGMCGALGILAAIMAWQQTGRGQQVELALIDTMFNFMTGKVAEAVIDKHEPLRELNLPIAVPSRHFQGADGRWFSVSVVNDAAFARFCDVIEHPELARDARFASISARISHRHVLLDMLPGIFAEQPAHEWLNRFDRADIPAGPINTVSQAVADPVLAGRWTGHAALPGLPQIPFPSQLTHGMRSLADMAPAPRLAQHTASILSELGYSTVELASLIESRVIRTDAG